MVSRKFLDDEVPQLFHIDEALKVVNANKLYQNSIKRDHKKAKTFRTTYNGVHYDISGLNKTKNN